MKFPFDGNIGADKKLAQGIFLLLFLASISGLNAAERINIKKNYQVIEAENKVWLAIPNGLFQFDSGDDSFKRFVIPENLSSQAVREIEYNDEWLWCIMDSSLAAMHIRLNEWLIFNETNGLPSNSVTGIDFTDDYIYISTTKGAARYDLIIEEWELLEHENLSDKPVKDVIVIEDKVYFFTDQSVLEFSPDFENWRYFEISQDTALRVSQAYYYNNFIWLVSNQGLVQYNYELVSFLFHTNSFLQPGAMLEIFTEYNNNWILTRNGLFTFGSESEVWSDFEANSYLEDINIINGYIDNEEIWIFTDKDVHVYNRSDKSWTVLDYASGLSTTVFQSGYINGGMAFLISDHSIEQRLNAEDSWYHYEIKQYSGKGGLSAKKILANMFDNEAGGYIPIGNKKWSWEGSRITYIYDLENTWYEDYNSKETVSGFRLDVKSQFGITPGRTISGFYNNIDYSETMYGIRYRSKMNDYLREFNWGDYRHLPGDIPFGETASMFGSNIWLQAGKKTEKYKRSLVTVKAQTGQRRSQKNYEYILGSLDKFSVSVEDIDYLKYQFYRIPYHDTSQIVSDIEIYADDLISGNNTPNTETKTIAGIRGDFDLLKATSDYYYYEKANVIRFTGYTSSTATLVIRYTVENQVYEDVLQQDSTISTSMSNIYSLQGMYLVPISVKLNITDTNGTVVPIADFGLDENNDDLVDKRWIDYENGLLLFPDKTPFPPDVYDETNPVNYYNINADFDTEYSLTQLEHDNLVRGTETVKLDGVTVKGGTDYVLDYTIGTLVFVKDGIVTPETRIEIEYEYYLSDDYTKMHTATVNVSPSDNVSVQADWVNFKDENDSTVNLITLNSELRHKAGEFDLRLTPAVAFQAEESKLTAYYVEAVASSSWLRFQSKYEKFDEDYTNIYNPQSVVGQVKENLEAGLSVDVHKNIRISGTYDDIKSFGTEQSTNDLYDKNATGSILFHHPELPGYEITYVNTKTLTDTSSVDKSYIQQRLEYQLPQKIAEKLLIKGLKLEGYLKTGVQSGEEIAGINDQKFLQGKFRINLNLGKQFQTSLAYRKNDFSDNSNDSTQKKRVLTSERVLFTLSHEKWKLIQTNLRIENTMDSYEYPVDDDYDLSLSQYTQLNFRLSPGELWKKLSALFFEFNINHALYATGTSTGRRSQYIWSALPTESNDLNKYQYLRTYYLKNEIRPNPNLYFYLLYEWNDQTTTYDLSSLDMDYWRLSGKFDAKLGLKTRVSLQYKQYDRDLGYNETTTYYEPSVWLERRWTNSFQNYLYVAYRHTKDFEGDIRDYIHKIEGRYDIVYRKKDLLKIRRIELQQSFSGGQTRTTGYNEDNYYYLGSSTGLDLFPLHSLIIRFQFNVIRTINVLNSDESNWTTDLNLRLSFNF